MFGSLYKLNLALAELVTLPCSLGSRFAHSAAPAATFGCVSKHLKGEFSSSKFNVPFLYSSI